MFTKFADWFRRRKEPEAPPEDIFERITNNLEVLTNGLIHKYSVRKAMAIKVILSSKNPTMLGKWTQDAGFVVDSESYVPENWKSGTRTLKEYTLDDFMSTKRYTIDPTWWLADNKGRIDRMLAAFAKLQPDDLEYYQRNYNSVIGDVDAILQGMVQACS